MEFSLIFQSKKKSGQPTFSARNNSNEMQVVHFSIAPLLQQEKAASFQKLSIVKYIKQCIYGCC
jgi:hypothetical protein